MEFNYKECSLRMLGLYLIMFLAFGSKYNFKFTKGDVVGMLIVYGIFTIMINNTYRMTIDSEIIKIYKIIGKNKFIELKDICKIGMEGSAYQLKRTYTLVIYTMEKEHKVSISAFSYNKVREYFPKLCKERGIEYQFKR